MNLTRLRQHIRTYKQKLQANPQQTAADIEDRANRVAFCRHWTATRLRNITRNELLNYLGGLWAMLIWGNKPYVIDKLIEDNTLSLLSEKLADLVWGDAPIAKRWDEFRTQIKGIGPAMMSELLCCTHPEKYLLWNRRAFIGLEQLGVPDLPHYNYQLTGKRYAELCTIGEQIAREMTALASTGTPPADLLIVDYFLWSELQGSQILNQIHRTETKTATDKTAPVSEKIDTITAVFVHNEVRDKLADIGNWLGLKGRTEVTVADGAKIDAIWETTIGNMGRVIYAFEVQTKGSIDSLILNLLKTLNNPAVQSIVAVSDTAQLTKIKKEAAAVPALREKLKYWNYTEVLEVHESLEGVNETINRLGLVPQGF